MEMENQLSPKLDQDLQSFVGTVRTARKNRCSLSTHPFYSRKARSELAALKKSFLTLKRSYPPLAFPGIASQISRLEPLMLRATELLKTDARELLSVLDEMELVTSADLAAEIDALGSRNGIPSTPFIPEDVVDERRGVLKKVLFEVNECYERECFNASAAMIRRLVESLILDAFEHHGIADSIKANGEYLEFGALIGRAAAESRFALTRTARKVLPDLKFLGDLGAHNRKALVRKDDLDRIRNQARLAVEELARASS